MSPRSVAILFLTTLFLLANTSCVQEGIRVKIERPKISLPSDTASLALLADSAVRVKDNYTTCLAANALGKAYRDASRFPQAVAAHNFALNAAEALQDSFLIARTLNNIGTVYRRIGLLPIAADFHYKALEISELMTEDDATLKLRVVSLNGLGNVYLTLDNNTIAEQFFRSAMVGESKLGSYLGMAINLANIGSIFQKNGQYDSAFVYYQRSMELNSKIGSEIGIALCHTYLGQLAESKGSIPKAITEYETAYEQLLGSQDEWHALTPCLAMARINMETANYAKALRYLNEARQAAERIGSIEHLADIYKLYYAVYDKKGDIKLALDAFRQAEIFSDSIVNIKTINDIQNIRLNIHNARQRRLLDEAEKNTLAQKQEKLLAMTILTLLLIIVGAGLVITLFALRSRKREQRMAAEFQRVKDRFFTNVTHEFRTPLTVVMAAADDIIKRSHPDSPDALNAKVINSQSASLLNLINQILDIAKLRNGAKATAPKWCRGDVAAFMENVARDYVNMAASRGVTLEVSDTPMPHADVVPDFAIKICRNLVANAIKFTPEGGRVSLSFAIDADSIVMTVADTGCGMTLEQQLHAFEPFYQGQTDSAAIGTGVGLSIVKSAADEMGWNINLSSQYGSGSVFNITIPTKPAHHAVAALDIVNTGAHPVVSTDQHLPQDDPETDELRSTILVVEDNADVAFFIGQQLRENHRVVFAADGVQGWQKAQDVVPDLIVSDVMMPGIDGIELCRRIRAAQPTAHIPIVMVTAKSAHEDRLQGIEVGVDAYIEKPFHADELVLVVNKLLESRARLRTIYSQIVESPRAQKPKPSQPENTPDQQPQDAAPAVVSPADAEFISKVGDAIRSMMSNGEVDIAAVADVLFVTRHQLNRKVNALCGMSTSNLVKQIRIIKAKELLATTNIPIADVATECGIDSVAYFGALFKKQVGTTPSKFRTDNLGER